MNSELSPHSAVPLHRQLRTRLLRRIEAGEFELDGRVPSENELAAEYGISRATARHVLTDLDAEGRIVRIVGKGSFLAPDLPVDHITGFGDNMREIGREPSYRVISLDAVVPPREFARRLDLPGGSRAYRVLRLLIADDEPVGIAKSFLPVRLLADAGVVLSWERLEEDSLYALLETEVGVSLDRAVEEVRPGLADGEQATVLDVADGDLVLRVDRLVLDDEDNPVELARITYVAERYVYRAELFRGSR